MTRGTPYLILKDRTILSDEFNGDMYGSPQNNEWAQKHGCYSEMVTRLKKVKSEEEFRKEMRAFNSENHNHNPFGFYTDKREDIDFSDDYFGNFSSDYLFFKNMSGKPVRIIDSKKHRIELKHGSIATFHFGEFIEII